MKKFTFVETFFMEVYAQVKVNYFSSINIWVYYVIYLTVPPKKISEITAIFWKTQIDTFNLTNFPLFHHANNNNNLINNNLIIETMQNKMSPGVL